MDADPDPAGQIWLQLLLLLVLIFVNAFFAASEIAVISLNDAKIRKMAEDGHKKAQQILKLTADSSNFLATIQIGVTLAGLSDLRHRRSVAGGTAGRLVYRNGARGRRLCRGGGNGQRGGHYADYVVFLPGAG